MSACHWNVTLSGSCSATLHRERPRRAPAARTRARRCGGRNTNDDRDRDHQDAGRERADEVHEPVADRRVGVAGRREHEHTAGSAISNRQRVPAQQRAPVGHERQARAHEQQPIGSTIAGVRRLREADEQRGREPALPPPARDAEQQQRGAPRERLLAEQQRLDDRGVGEHRRGPPAAPQLGKREERRRDAAERAERRVVQRDAPVAEQRPEQRGRRSSW